MSDRDDYYRNLAASGDWDNENPPPLTLPDLSDPVVVDAIFADARHTVRAEQRARATRLRRQRNQYSDGLTLPEGVTLPDSPAHECNGRCNIVCKYKEAD